MIKKYLLSILFLISVISAYSQNDDVIVYSAVQEKPVFQGGAANAFQKWVIKNLEYPSVAKDLRIEGRVTVQFIINTNGSVSDVVVLSGVDKLLDKEAVRVVSSSPKWTPGKHDGKITKVRYILPVVFRL